MSEAGQNILVISPLGRGANLLGVAIALAAGGNSVSVLCSRSSRKTKDHAATLELLARRGVCVRYLEPAQPESIVGFLGDSMQEARWVYEYLKNNAVFDAVYFGVDGPAAYYCLMAKELGLGFAKVHFCAVIAESVFVKCRSSRRPLANKGEILLAHSEFYAYGHADVVVFASHFLQDFYRKQYGERERGTAVIPSLFCHSADFEGEQEVRPIKKFVCFSESCTRSGLSLLVESIERLACKGDGDLGAVFVGKTPKSVLGRCGAVCRGEVEYFPSHSSLEYLSHLGGDSGVLVLFPSSTAGSMHEADYCLSLGIPFLLVEEQGLHESVSANSIGIYTARPFTKFFAQAINVLVQSGAGPVCREVSVANLSEHWRELGKRLSRQNSCEVNCDTHTAPFVSVCLIHHDRPQYLAQALESLTRQTYNNFEVVLTDDGSVSPAALAYLDDLEEVFAKRQWKIIRQKNLHAGAARNASARAAAGEFLLFMDDDNIAKPHEIETFVECMRNGQKDILTCFYDGFTSTGYPQESDIIGRYTPLGGGVSLGLFENCYGDSNCFVRKSAFWGVDGFTEYYGIGREDHEFFARIALKGYSWGVIPEALYWYRCDSGSLSVRNRHRPEGALRVLDAYVEECPVELKSLLHIALATQLPNFQSDSLTWRIANGVRVFFAERLKAEKFLRIIRSRLLRW